jgi:hypothetical protein
MEFQEYWDVIQQRICPRCIDGDGIGNCRLPVGERCALKSFLPQVVTTVMNTTSSTLDGYIAELRNNICTLCQHQQADFSCLKRLDLECALDRYYPLVVEIIETVQDIVHRE